MTKQELLQRLESVPLDAEILISIEEKVKDKRYRCGVRTVTHYGNLVRVHTGNHDASGKKYGPELISDWVSTV